MPRETVVITGVGIVSAIGIGQQAFFEALLRGESGVRSLAERTDEEAAPGPDDRIDGVWIGAPIVAFDAKQFVKPRKALKVMCREIQTAFAAAQLAVDHAGLSESIPATSEGCVSPNRLGTVFGSEIFFNPPQELAESIRGCIDSQGELQGGRFGEIARREVMPLWMLKYLPNMPACQVGISINSQGPNNSLVLGDVSGPAALIESESYLLRGIADIVLVGATGTRIGSTRMLYHRDLPVPQKGASAIEDLSRPHDPESTGVVGGEGAAALVVETASHASRRNANVLAVVLATASRFSPSAAIRSGVRAADIDTTHSRSAASAIVLAIQAVLQKSGLAATDVGLVISHAVGDRQLDSGEADALAEAGIDCPLVAVSAALGHTGAASGIIELATGVLAIANQTIPPTRHLGIDSRVKFTKSAQELRSSIVLCLSHSTDGNATAVLLGPTEQG